VWWRWTTVILLTMVPALVAGQSAGLAAGLAYGFAPVTVIAVVALTSFVAGLGWIKLTELGLRVPRLQRALQRLHRPSAVDWCNRWGPWGGLTIGAAVVGPEPILIALKSMTIETRKLLLPLAVSSIGFTLLYYLIVWQGLEQGAAFGDDLQLLFDLWR
jgi:hypothetical protein